MLKKILPEDAKNYVNLRNQENTYKWFFSKQKFTEEKTREWIESLDSAKEEVFLYIEKEGVIGTISIYNIQKDIAEIGRIIIDETFRGQGLGKKLLQELVSYIKNSRGDIRVLYAYIMNENISSQKTFEGCRFELVQQLEDRKYYELELK